ncbi:MAG: DUF4326 domain-containing protein [Advenella sp.]
MAADSATRVVNIRRGEPYDVLVDRTSFWGNPFYIGVDGSRQEVIEKYRQMVLSRPDMMARLPELRGKTLACWCKPKMCHADVLAQLADQNDG